MNTDKILVVSSSGLFCHAAPQPLAKQLARPAVFGPGPRIPVPSGARLSSSRLPAATPIARKLLSGRLLDLGNSNTEYKVVKLF
jgi:hypothetical protein